MKPHAKTPRIAINDRIARLREGSLGETVEQAVRFHDKVVSRGRSRRGTHQAAAFAAAGGCFRISIAF